MRVSKRRILPCLRSRNRFGLQRIFVPDWNHSARRVPVSPCSRGCEMPGPLQGLRVIDFSRVLAGPLCGRTLADLGADVIKIEPPRPDVSRFSYPYHDGMSGYYAQQNIGKRNVSIDLNVPGAIEIVRKLCDKADTIVENFRPETLRF